MADFLMKHPGAVTVPAEFPGVLLSADYVDARVIGLKLLVRNSDAPDRECAEQLASALESKDLYEASGGLYELSCILHSTHNTHRQIDAISAALLRRSLEAVIECGDEYMRTNARVKRDDLQEFL